MRPRFVLVSLLVGCASPTPADPAPVEPPAAPVQEPPAVSDPPSDDVAHPEAYVGRPPTPRLVAPALRCFTASHVVTLPDDLRAIDFVDVDGDRRRDLLATDDRAVTVLLGRADGSFARRSRVQPDHDVDSTIAGDVTGDGKLDLIAVGHYGDVVSLLVGRGDGSFTPRRPGLSVPRPQDGVIANFTGDRRGELALLLELTIVTLRSRGGKLVQDEGELETGPAHRPQAADFDEDGKLDLIVPETVSSDLGELAGVYLGKGDGTFAPAIPVPGTAHGTPPVIADLDGDGHLDLALTRHDQDFVQVVRGDGTGRFSEHVQVPIEEGVSGLFGADVTRDGRLDLVVGASFGVDTFANDGTGEFTLVARDGGGRIHVAWAGDSHGSAAIDAVVTTDAEMRVWTGIACSEQPASAQPGRRPCADGESLASGCECTDRTCMDICCVGSACSHGGGPDQAWSKCVSAKRR